MNSDSEFALWRKISDAAAQYSNSFVALEKLLSLLSESELISHSALLLLSQENRASQFITTKTWKPHQTKLQHLAENCLNKKHSEPWPADHPMVEGLLDAKERLIALPLSFRSQTYGALLLASPAEYSSEEKTWLNFARRLANFLVQNLALSWAYQESISNTQLPSDQSQLLSVILEQMAEAVLVADRSGKFRFFNPQAEALLGSRPNIKPEQWTKHYGTHCLDDKGEMIPTPYDKVPMYRALRGERVDNQELFLRSGGREEGIWVSVNSRPLQNEAGESLGAVSVCRDVTKLKLAQEKTEQAQRDFRRVIEASRDGIGIHRDGRWVYVNSALLKILGYGSSEDLRRVPLKELLSTKHQSHDWLGSHNTEKPSPIAEVQLKKCDGSIVMVEASTAMLTDFEGGEAILVAFRDLTERKRLESQMMVSDRMASLGTLAAGVGHEINNPLSVVTMNLEMAIDELRTLEAAGDTPEMLKEALQAAKRVSHIVKDLKVLSSSDVDEVTPVDLHSVLNSTSRVLVNEIRHRAVLIKEFAPDIPLVMAVEPRLGQVVLNLLMNAAQAIPEGAADSNFITLSTEYDDGFLSFTVTDTGLGIEAEVARQMFTPFFSTKPIGTATGLGLPMCHRIVTNMGGSISFDSKLGQGTSFTVRLPAAPTNTGSRLNEPRSPKYKNGKGKVLVVDDEPFICKCVQRILSQDHSVDVCEDGSEALENIRHGQRYDVIVCDLMMPRMTGIQLFEALQSEAPDQAKRMVFLTGGAFTTPARSFLDSTPNPVLYKPCETKILRNTVNGHLTTLGRV